MLAYIMLSERMVYWTVYYCHTHHYTRARSAARAH